jgi:tetratricopeptide (TPR) repeat protein
MNRAGKRRNKKIADQGAKKAKLIQASSPIPAKEEQTLTIQQALDLALQHHTAGDLPKAESIYQQILQADPNQPVALHLLGVIAHQLGKNDIAVEFITKALTIKPDYAEAYSNLGLAFHGLGNLDGAVASYNKAIAIKPDYAEAYSNLGISLQALDKFDETVASYKKAIAIKPDYAEVHNNLGIVFSEFGQLDEAVESYNKAIAIKPGFAGAHFNQHSIVIDPMDMAPSIVSRKQLILIHLTNSIGFI